MCLPIPRWGFTFLAVAGFYADQAVPALLATALATVAWRHN